MSNNPRFWEVVLVGLTLIVVIGAMVYSLLELANFFVLDPVNNLI